MEHYNDNSCLKEEQDIINGEALKKKFQLLSEQQTTLKNEDSSLKNYCPKPFNRNYLVERLKLMEADSSQRIYIPCARTPMASMPMYYSIKCEECEKECFYETSSWDFGWHYGVAARIVLLGYDAQICNLCLDCVLNILKDKKFITRVSDFNKLKSLYASHEPDRHNCIDGENINYYDIKNNCSLNLFHCFFFRVDKNENWHVAESDDTDDYECLDKFLSIRDEEISIKECLRRTSDPIARIKKMTGLL